MDTTSAVHDVDVRTPTGTTWSTSLLFKVLLGEQYERQITKVLRNLTEGVTEARRTLRLKRSAGAVAGPLLLASPAGFVRIPVRSQSQHSPLDQLNVVEPEHWLVPVAVPKNDDVSFDRGSGRR